MAQGFIKKEIIVNPNARPYVFELYSRIRRSTKYTIPKAKKIKVGSGRVVLEKKTLNGSSAKNKAAKSPARALVYFLVIRYMKIILPRDANTDTKRSKIG